VRAKDLAVPAGIIGVDDTLMDAAARLVREHLSGLVVVSESGRPLAVVPASQVLGLAVPAYVREDPALAGVVDEASADRAGDRLRRRTVASLVSDSRPDQVTTIDEEANLLEVAEQMSREHTPVLVVVGADGLVRGTVSARDVLARLLGPT
jgi:CBS domain-containing protein